MIPLVVAYPRATVALVHPRQALKSSARTKSTGGFDRFVVLQAPNELACEWCLGLPRAKVVFGLAWILLGLAGHAEACRGRLRIAAARDSAVTVWPSVITATNAKNHSQRVEFRKVA